MINPAWKYLVSGGTTGQTLTKISSADGDFEWSTPSSGGTPGGSTTQIQYNNAGAFGGNANLTYDGSLFVLKSSGSLTYPFTVNDSNGNPMIYAQEGTSSRPNIAFGDINQVYQYTSVAVFDNDRILQLNAPAGQVQIGDWLGANNFTKFLVDDANGLTSSNVKHEASGNVTVMTNGQGLHQQSPNGHYWRLDISNAGAASWTDIGTSPP